MGRISSSVGLVSGLPTAEIIDQLMQVANVPRNTLARRTEDLQNQQLAVGSLTSKLLSLQFDFGKLKQDNIFNSKKVASSDKNLLTATITDSSKAALSNYKFTPVRTAKAQQLVSQRFTDENETFTTQSLSFRKGGFVDKGISLEQLNSGLGVRLGEIRITDKSGQSAVIDLRHVTSVDDVLQAINSNSTINVTASTSGDSFQLTDNTGQSGTLSVQEVNNGNTATDLGLAGASASGVDTTVTGGDVFTLHAGTRLTELNDGNGVFISDDTTDVDDLVFQFADESPEVGIDLSGKKTLGDIVDAINNHEDLAGKVAAAIAGDGNRLELTDLTTGAGTFSVSNGVLGTAADDLGISVDAAGDTITGERLVSGLRDTLLSSVNGGQGISTLGNVDITNRDGVLSSIDLSGVETINELVDAINSQATGVTAAINTSRSGIELTDTTGGTASNLIVADSGSSTTATDLGIAVDDAVTSVNSGNLKRQTLSKATLLSAVNGNQGITTIGDISITDTNGVRKALDLNSVGSEPKTVGDVLNAINTSGAGVTAQINDAGDGIVLLDTAGGAGNILVTDVNGTLAAELGLAGESSEVDVDGTPTQVIDSTSLRNIEIEDGETLAQVVEKINSSQGGVTAALLNDGVGVRMSLTVNQTGAANALLLELEDSDFQFQEISSAQDALLQLGDSGNSGGSILVSSADNEFSDVVSGVNLNILGESTSPVSVEVSKSDTALTTAVKDFVDGYNAIRDELAELTDFDQEELTTGLLFGSNEALRVDTQLSRLVTDRYFGLGSFQSLQEIGISVNDQGKLELDEAQLQEAFVNDPEGLKKFLADEDLGVITKFDAAIEQLAGENNGLLTNRTDALQNTIDTNEQRIEQMDASLERQRENLVQQYAQLESIIAEFEEAQAALSSFQPVPPLSSVQRNR